MYSAVVGTYYGLITIAIGVLIDFLFMDIGKYFHCISISRLKFIFRDNEFKFIVIQTLRC